MKRCRKMTNLTGSDHIAMSEHIPMRTCIGCRKIREKRELIRIVRSADGSARADPSGGAPGRGAYLCADPSCLEKALKKKAFNRTFSCAVSRENVTALQEEISAQILRRCDSGPSRTPQNAVPGEVSVQGTDSTLSGQEREYEPD